MSAQEVFTEKGKSVEQQFGMEAKAVKKQYL